MAELWLPLLSTIIPIHSLEKRQISKYSFSIECVLSHMIIKIKTQNVDSINPLNYKFPGSEGLKPSKKSIAEFIYVFAQHMCIISVIS